MDPAPPRTLKMSLKSTIQLGDSGTIERSNKSLKIGDEQNKLNKPDRSITSRRAIETKQAHSNENDSKDLIVVDEEPFPTTPQKKSCNHSIQQKGSPLIGKIHDTPASKQKNHKPNTSTSTSSRVEVATTRLKNILKQPYRNGPTRAARRTALITEHDAKAKYSSLRRDQEIKAAKDKHLAYVKALDEELERDLRELSENGDESDQKRPESTPRGFNDFMTKQDKSKHGAFEFHPKPTVQPIPMTPIEAREGAFKKSFIPFRLPITQLTRETSEQLALLDSQTSESALGDTSLPTDSSSTSFERAFSPARQGTPTSEVRIRPSLSHAKTENPNSFNNQLSSTPLKRKSSLGFSFPNKKVHATSESNTSPALIPSNIETDPIRPKLTAYPFCFVSAWNVDVKEENLKLMRKMVETFNFYPEAVRADDTGYFLIFEASDKGEEMAEKCGQHFKKWKFRKQHMYPQFCARGSATGGV